MPTGNPIAQGVAGAVGSPVAKSPNLGGFLPDQLAGLVLWTRFNQGITVTGSGVSQWDDQSGEGNHLLQSTDALRPLLQGDGSVLFDGTDDWLKAASFTLVQPETIYILVNQKTWVSSRWLFDGHSSSTGSMFQVTSTPRNGIYAGTTLSFVSPVLDTYNILSTVFNGALSVLQLNNGAPVTGNAGAGNMDGFTLGATGAGTAWTNIQVKEVIIYNRAHDAATRTKVINYLSGIGAL